MKTRSTICMLFLAIACAVWAGSDDTTTRKVKCEFRLVAVAAETNHGAMVGRFAFRHQEAGPIQLYGFGFTGTNTFRVRFEQFQREDDGKWSRVKVGYCGTGARLYPIEPNKDFVFLVPLWPFLEKGQKGLVEVQGTNVTVASSPFDTAEIRKIDEARKKTANKMPEDTVRKLADPQH